MDNQKIVTIIGILWDERIDRINYTIQDENGGKYDGFLISEFERMIE